MNFQDRLKAAINILRAAPKATPGIKRDKTYAPTIVPKSISRTRADMQVWDMALKTANNADTPKRVKLMQLYDNIMQDSLLTSQIENRKLNTLGSQFIISNADGKENEEVTNLLAASNFFNQIINAVLDARYYGYSVIELSNTDKGLQATVLARTNIEPVKGLFFADYTSDSSLKYRELPEYGTWILEANFENLGLLNNAVPHVLFKRFAQSCWSELCEIYGIPPRVMKTDTFNPAMLDRADQMMRDMGAAAYFIIDETESFEFADSVNTNGDVYKNLIALCNNEMSLLISGAVIGQDTAHGNRSKEDSSIQMLEHLIAADKIAIQHWVNATLLPALFAIGIVPQGLQMLYKQSEDIEALWSKIVNILPHKDVDDTFITDKFGIPVAAKKTTNTNLSLDFFDEGLH